MIQGCYISPPISYHKFNDTIRNTGNNPLINLNFKCVNIIKNPILDMIIEHIPTMHTNPNFCVNNKWYKVQLLAIVGKVFRFAQYVITSPSKGAYIKSIRYVDIVIV